MCSGARSAITEIAEAIDRLAADHRALSAHRYEGIPERRPAAPGASAATDTVASPDTAAKPGTRSAPDVEATLDMADMAARVAALWAMVAELDPEVDRLKSGYERLRP